MERSQKAFRISMNEFNEKFEHEICSKDSIDDLDCVWCVRASFDAKKFGEESGMRTDDSGRS